MSSPAPSQNTGLISIKLNFDDASPQQRLMVPLTQLGRFKLPVVIRQHLSLPPDSKLSLERFSDSSASYVPLDSGDTAIYKQLYRAAKAKGGIRLRVSIGRSKGTLNNSCTRAIACEEATLISASKDQAHFNPAQNSCERAATSSHTHEEPFSHEQNDNWQHSIVGGPRIFSSGLDPNSKSSAMSISIHCNNCQSSIPDIHWHCGVCDGGDYDLCAPCIEGGVMCNDNDHWLIRRLLQDGKIINSSTTTSTTVPPAKSVASKQDVHENEVLDQNSTCNVCLNRYPLLKLLSCKTCEKYNICVLCHVGSRHGHHPAHEFSPLKTTMLLDPLATKLLKPGRAVRHDALCDGCDAYIIGSRHKCLDCPDWDFCSKCVLDAPTKHPRHRFLALHEPLHNGSCITSKALHSNILCDGPLCKDKTSSIRGDRYKCAICNDVDFCANCEAFPLLMHNRTHPLIKMKTEIRQVVVDARTETGEFDKPKPGDSVPKADCVSKSTETYETGTEVTARPITEAICHQTEIAKSSEYEARFICDTITDGSVVAPETVIEQTWTLQNTGSLPWPVGCSVCFVGGDNMVNLSTAGPSSVKSLQTCLQSTSVDREISHGEIARYTLKLRAPERDGRSISYWRLKLPDGTPFGDKLWCDISVQTVTSVSHALKKDEPSFDHKTVEPASIEAQASQMIFPKLDKESPMTSCHSGEVSTQKQHVEDLLEILDIDDASTSTSEDGYLSDEDYEIIATDVELEELGSDVK